MPTLRDRTSTSSAAIVGTSMSCTAARCGSSKTSAFMSRSSQVDEHLDFVGGARCQPLKDVRGVVECDRARDHTVDGKVTCGDLGRDAIEVVHPVAPGADNCQVVQ